MRTLPAAALFSALSALAGACAGPEAVQQLRLLHRPNVLLITIDTLRADRLPAYGFNGVETPAIDALARRGITFDNAYSTTPLTLPAHASLLTGTYPTLHGVRDNGGFVASPELVTLAEVLSEHGYRTGAFVSAFVLDSRWGLDQGIATYHDEFRVPREHVVSLGAVQRPAGETVDAALAWLGGGGDAPWFLWVHLYDPHTPYEPPPPFAETHAGTPYLGEIAYTDSQVGRLTEWLQRAGQLESTIVVLTADHGEGLGDHGELEHGLLIYDESVRVPLILTTPVPALHGLRRAALASHTDVMPTVLDVLGVPLPANLHGASLLPAIADPEASVHDRVYFESWYARYHFGWSELYGVRDVRHKLIVGPVSELFDLQRDPAETQPLSGSNTVYARLHRDAEELRTRLASGSLAAAAGQLDLDTRQKLASLGYLSGSPVETAGQADLPDPRTKIGAYNMLLSAREHLGRGADERAETMLRQLIAEEPGISDAYLTLGNLLSRRQRFAEAAEAFRAAIPLRPDDAGFYALLANALLSLGDLDGAERVASDAERLLDPDPRLQFLLGSVALRRGDGEGAAAHFEAAAVLGPDSAVIHGALAGARLQTGEMAAAAEHARAALALDPGLPDMHFMLGQVQQAGGDLAAAEREYRAEIATTPDHLRATYALAVLARERQDAITERQLLRRTLEIEPEFRVAHLHLARLDLENGIELRAAVQRVQLAMQGQLSRHDQALACFLLADLYNRLGDDEASRHWAAEGRRISAGAG